MTEIDDPIRLTQTAPGGGCSCKIAPGALEALLARAYGPPGTSTVLATEARAGQTGAPPMSCSAAMSTATTLRSCGSGGTTAVVTTTDFFTPVVDDPFEWGRIAAANALSDVYAMGGEPVVALNLLAWPVDRLPDELAIEVLRGGRAATDEARCWLAGGHSIVDETPKYGLAVTGTADPNRLLRNDAARPGDPISLTKPLGLGILNNRHKATGERFPEAVATMCALNGPAARAALAAGLSAATDVTGFGLLGHLYKMARAEPASPPASKPPPSPISTGLEPPWPPATSRGDLAAISTGCIPTCRPTSTTTSSCCWRDAQTSGGLLVAGELPGAPVIGRFTAAAGPTLTIR